MRHTPSLFLALALLVTGFPTLSDASSAQPELYRILEQLFRYSATSIKEMPDCKGSFAHVDGDNYTLGRYLGDLISNMAEEGDNKVRFSCEPAKEKGWTCDVEFQHNVPRGEPLFSYGVRVFVDHSGVVQMRSLSCIGTG